jgi:hypothetical protein
MGIDISSIPDATVLCNFRSLLAANNLGGKKDSIFISNNKSVA